MEFLQRLLLFVGWTSLIFLAIGLYEPWVMLWWEDMQNRRKVIKLYGLAAVVSFILHWIIKLINQS